MPLADNPQLYIIGLSWLVNIIFIAFILYSHRERKMILKHLDEINRSISKKDQAISEQAAQLAEAYEKLRKINERLEDEVRLRTDKLTIQHAKALEYAHHFTHKLRGTLASMVGLLQLAENEEMSQSLSELLVLMNICTHQLDEVLHDFTRKFHDDL
jgi:hypothetical protein